MRLFWWLYCLIFVVAGIVKANDTYLLVAGLFAIAAAIGEVGWRAKGAIDELYKVIFEEDETKKS